MKRFATFAFAGALCGFGLASQAATVTLIDEEFTGGSFDDASIWSSTDSLFEVYSNGGFSVRGISGGATPAAPLGGLEVLANATSNTITITVDLPTFLDDSVDGVFTFLAGQRIEAGSGGFEGDLEIINVTDNRVIRAKSAVNHPNFTLVLNTETLDFLASDAGDTLELRFYESAGNSARGLQLADLQLDVTVIPEPGSLALLGLGGLLIARRRRG